MPLAFIIFNKQKIKREKLTIWLLVYFLIATYFFTLYMYINLIKMKYLITFICILLMYGTTSSQEKFSLDDCILYALENKMELKREYLNVKSAKLNMQASSKLKNPDLRAGLNTFWNYGRTVDPTTNNFVNSTLFVNNYSIRSTALLWNHGRLKNSVKREKLSKRAADYQYKQLEMDITFHVVRNFLNVLFTEETIKQAEAQMKMTEQQLSNVNMLITKGVRPESDRLNIVSQIVESEQRLVIAENDLQVALLNLKQSMNIHPSEDLIINRSTEMILTMDPDTIEFQSAYAIAKNNTPALYAGKLNIKSAEENIKIAKASLYPTLSASASLNTVYSNQGTEVVGFNSQEYDQNVILNSTDPVYNFQDTPVSIATEALSPILRRTNYRSQLDQNLSFGLEIGLSIPIYDKGFVKNGISRAKLECEDLKYQQQQRFDQLKIELEQLLLEAKSAKKRTQVSEKRLKAQSEVFDNITKRMELGSSSTFEWEIQRTNFQNVELAALAEKYNYIFAVRNLEFYLGKILQM